MQQRILILWLSVVTYVRDVKALRARYIEMDPTRVASHQPVRIAIARFSMFLNTLHFSSPLAERKPVTQPAVQPMKTPVSPRGATPPAQPAKPAPMVSPRGTPPRPAMK